VLSTFSVTATYWFINTATRDRDAALAGASYFALTPALIVFLPQFDQIYPALACALLVTWMLALRTGKLSWSIALGVILWLITFTTYTLLVLGVFLIGYWFLTRAEGRRALKISAISLAIIVAMYALLWITTGYNPLATFRTVLTLQSAMKTELNRPWLATVPADFVDLLMGLCWLALLLLVFHFINRHNRSSIAWLGLVQILIVAFTGLLPGETARVWMFMVPLLMVPVGLELSRWLPQHRWMVYLCLWLLVMMTGQNLRFH
jgi:hypothetical protein